jgi:hypothetical protein
VRGTQIAFNTKKKHTVVVAYTFFHFYKRKAKREMNKKDEMKKKTKHQHTGED